MKINRIESLPRLSLLLTLCMAISVVAIPTSAKAQTWRIEPVIRVGGEYDDNATLDIRTDSEVTLEGFLADLRADLSYSSETTSFFIQPRVVVRSYSDEPDFDSEDFFLRSHFEHERQSDTVGFRGNIEQQEVRTGERAISDIEIDDPNDITDDDTGQVLLSGSRSKWRISPYWDRRLSNISSIRVDLDYFDVGYEDVFAGFLADYSDARLNLSYRRAFSNVHTGLVTVSARRYDTAAAASDITGFGIMVGFERGLTEKTRLRAMVGVEDTQQQTFSSNLEAVGNVTLTRSLETISMFAQYRRSVSASGAGTLAVRDALNLSFRRRLNEKISAGLGVRAYRSRLAGNLPSIDDRNYVQLHSNFRWYLSAALVIEADYRYTVNDRNAVVVGGRSNSNQVNLWFVYQPRTIPKI